MPSVWQINNNLKNKIQLHLALSHCHFLRLSHQQILEILVDTVDAVDVIATHRHFIDFKYVKDIIGICRDFVYTVDIS